MREQEFIKTQRPILCNIDFMLDASVTCDWLTEAKKMHTKLEERKLLQFQIVKIVEDGLKRLAVFASDPTSGKSLLNKVFYANFGFCRTHGEKNNGIY